MVHVLQLGAGVEKQSGLSGAVTADFKKVTHDICPAIQPLIDIIVRKDSLQIQSAHLRIHNTLDNR
jgi:hypothetical protein